jgi:hypothetical protein
MFAPFFQFAGSSGPSLAQFQTQAAAGLNVKLEYVNATTIKLSSNSGSTISVITPDLNLINVTTSGLTATVSGSTSTLYYVYLASAGLSFSTSAPDTTYTNMRTLSGTKILVGYMGFSATNTIAGTHNVYSFWNEPQRTWSQSLSSSSNSVNFTALSGLLVPPGCSCSFSITGSIVGRSRYGISECGDWYGSAWLSCTTSVPGSSSATGYMYDPYNYYMCTQTRTQTMGQLSQAVGSGIYSSISVDLSGKSFTHTVTCGDPNSPTYNEWLSGDFTITLTRPGS